MTIFNLHLNPPMGLLTLDQIEPFIQLHSSHVSGMFRDIQINSAFQPIFSLAHRRPVGFEALLRPVGSRWYPALAACGI